MIRLIHSPTHQESRYSSIMLMLTFILDADHPDDQGGCVFASPLEDAALRAVRVHGDPLPAGPGAQVLVVLLPGHAEAHAGVRHHLALHPHLVTS